MKRILTLTVILAIMTTAAGLAIAEDKQESAANEKRKTAPSQAEMLREKTRQSRLENMNSEERMARMAERKTQEIQKAKEQPEKLIAELEAIKASAIKEKAKDTALLVDKLIDSTKQKLEKKIANIEERHAKFEKLMSKGKGKREKLNSAEQSLKEKKKHSGQ